MKRRHFLALSLIAISIFTGRSQTAVSFYQPGITTEGAVYCLPKTALYISVKVEQKTYQPGTFCKYAQRHLKQDNVVQEPTTSYRVIDISQTPIGIPDTSKVYSIKFNPKTAASNFALSDDGILLSINATPKDVVLPDLFEPSAKPAPVDAQRYMTEDILSAGSTAKMAELTALEIFDLRENRNLLIKGQADFMPKDGTQLKLMLSQMEVQEMALTSLFCGTTTCDTTETIITIVPCDSVKQQVLFRLSQKLGLVDSDDLAGVPYYIYTENLKTVPLVDTEAKENQRKQQNGIYVNVPGKMRSTIKSGQKTYSAIEFPCAQTGNVELLSGDLFNKRFTTRLWLNPVTGAIEKLEAEEPK